MSAEAGAVFYPYAVLVVDFYGYFVVGSDVDVYQEIVFLLEPFHCGLCHELFVDHCLSCVYMQSEELVSGPSLHLACANVVFCWCVAKFFCFFLYLCVMCEGKSVVLTPMMRQFRAVKAGHPGCVVLFRCGDFYETYDEDASEVSGVLGLTLTRRRNRGDKVGATLMAGFPFHVLDSYIAKLVHAGRRVVVVDQLEDPKLAKGIVRRGVVEVVTPGLVTADGALVAKENNFLAAVHFVSSSLVGLALLDISTGEFFAFEGGVDEVGGLLVDFGVKEVLYERGKGGEFEGCFGGRYVLTGLDDWVFVLSSARELLLRHFGVLSLRGFGLEGCEAAVVAAGAVLQYLKLTEHTRLGHITGLSRLGSRRYVEVDKSSVRNLELVVPVDEGGVSLLGVLDHTVTPMGGRLLRRVVLFPLRGAVGINRRLDAVERLVGRGDLREVLRRQLCVVGDLERLAAKAATGRIHPRDVGVLCGALRAVGPVKEALAGVGCEELEGIGRRLNALEGLTEVIGRTLSDDPPAVLSKGNVIRAGANEELDGLRRIAYEGKDYLLQLQQREGERTGIPGLRVAYNNVFGYYLEVRNSQKDKVPSDWIRKQTLVNAERYITPELKDYENKILTAQERIAELEAQLFAGLVETVAKHTKAIQEDAALLARLDCYLSFAVTAQEPGYTRPEVADDDVIDIRQGRHPVIEKGLPTGQHYVPNDVRLDTTTQQIILVTGPNMAGKSALLRQTALITLMAQAGCYVPAEKAHIGTVDKIFTRTGAGDNISMGESTFMAEMNEAANILNNFTARSLILFDELGRGTATYDGISIAWAIAEYLHDGPRHARTLFATHYHELNEMAKIYPRIKNFNVDAREVNGKIVFLRTLRPGASEHSFGIHVAQLAGLPRVIITRAQAILKQLEANNTHTQTGLKADTGIQLSLFQLDDPLLAQIRDEILNTDINSLTPLEALNKLNSIQRLLKNK